MIGDRLNDDLYFALYDLFTTRPTKGQAERDAMLHEVATRRAGSEHASALVDAWRALHDVEEDVALFDMGGTVFYLGGVQQRWLTRPFVPFPEELTADERDYYRRYQFQATTEQRANNLHELQGARTYSGRGGQTLANKILGRMQQNLSSAQRSLRALAGNESSAQAGAHRLLAERLRVFQCLVQNCRNAIEYQYYLDLTKEWLEGPAARCRGNADRDGHSPARRRTHRVAAKEDPHHDPTLGGLRAARHHLRRRAAQSPAALTACGRSSVSAPPCSLPSRSRSRASVRPSSRFRRSTCTRMSSATCPR
jgi:hypothetical protein